jgi:hypothetical protein
MRNFKDTKTPVFKFKLVHVHDSNGVHVQMKYLGRVVDRQYADNSMHAKRSRIDECKGIQVMIP